MSRLLGALCGALIILAAVGAAEGARLPGAGTVLLLRMTVHSMRAWQPSARLGSS